MTRGTAQGRYAKLLLEQGVSYDEILKDSAMVGFNPATLRTIAKRVREAKEKTETQKQRNETHETANETHSDGAMKKRNKNPLAAIENPVSPVSETRNGRPILFNFIKTAFHNFHPVDALYYLGVGLCCNGVAKALHPVGWLVSVVVFGVAFIALQGLKTSQGLSRWKYTAAFVGVEIAAAISHIAWANEALWRNVERLPLDIWVNKYRNDLGEVVMLYGGSDLETPFKIACGIAACFFLSGIFVYFISTEKNELEATHK